MTDTPQPLWSDADIDTRLYGWFGDDTSDPGRHLITQYMRWMRDDYEHELAAARARVAELTADIVELYDALNERDNCRLCGGDGTRWIDAGNGEAEPENCECADEAYRLLLKHGKSIVELRRKAGATP